MQRDVLLRTDSYSVSKSMEDLYTSTVRTRAASFHPAGVGTRGNRSERLQDIYLQHASSPYDYLPAGVGTPLNRPTRRTSSTRSRGQNEDELPRQLQLLLNCQAAAGTRIAGIKTTNTITTTYKDGGPPNVRKTSTKVSNFAT